MLNEQDPMKDNIYEEYALPLHRVGLNPNRLVLFLHLDIIEKLRVIYLVKRSVLPLICSSSAVLAIGRILFNLLNVLFRRRTISLIVT